MSGPARTALDIDPQAHSFVGVKLTGMTAYGVATMIRSQLIDSRVRPLGDRDPDAVVAQVGV